MWRKELQEAVEAALSTVPEQYREILRLRYWEDMTLDEVGNLRGISKERVRQMENKGLRILRRPKAANQLYTFYDFNFYSGTGLGTFCRTDESVQDRYLIHKENCRERAERRQHQAALAVEMLRIEEEIRSRVAMMTPEKKQQLLELHISSS